jgi:hypothetical protein
MPQTQTMTLDEKLALSGKAAELWNSGDKEGYIRLMKTTPIPPYIAKVIKEKAGAEYLSGWNLSEAEAEFGTGWLNR